MFSLKPKLKSLFSLGEFKYTLKKRRKEKEKKRKNNKNGDQSLDTDHSRREAFF